MKFKRIFLVVLDSLGVGEAKDADKYGDIGSNTLGHIKDNYDLFIPNLKKLGFLDTVNMNENLNTDAYYTIARPNNAGKDTLTGHYELMGIKCDVAFKTFGETGFPRELIDSIEYYTGKRVIGNKAESGTKIIEELGERHMQTGALIIYTSADSNLQVAAHEDIIPLNKLYEICEIIRKLTMKEEWRVGRVIARPFNGRPGKFKRTEDRHDYAVKPPMRSVLDNIKEAGFHTIAIGKINDIFDSEGITKTIKAPTNELGVSKLIDIMDKNFTGLCFANLNEFDSLYGHRRDLEGYAKAIEELDVEIPLIINKLNNDDLLILTADHGNDPTFKGTDHTRENVPVILFSRAFKEPKRLDILESFADIGATISDNFKVPAPFIGTSFLDKLK
ncbi:MAG: phosphopentomutase [Bacilli bacterium]